MVRSCSRRGVVGYFGEVSAKLRCAFGLVVSAPLGGVSLDGADAVDESRLVLPEQCRGQRCEGLREYSDHAADLLSVVHLEQHGALPPIDLAAPGVRSTGPVVGRRIGEQIVDAVGGEMGPEPRSATTQAEPKPSGLVVQGADCFAASCGRWRSARRRWHPVPAADRLDRPRGPRRRHSRGRRASCGSTRTARGCPAAASPGPVGRRRRTSRRPGARPSPSNPTPGSRP